MVDGYVVNVKDPETGKETTVPVVYWEVREPGRVIGLVADPGSFPYLAAPPAGAYGYSPASAAAPRDNDGRKHRP